MNNKVKHICIFTTQFLPSIGGVENYCYNLAKELTNLGNRCIIVTCNTHNLPSNETTEYATIYRLECVNFLNGRYPITRINEKNKSIWEKIKKANIDYIVINTRFYHLSLQALQFSSRIKIKPIVIEHGSAHLTTGNIIADPFVHIAEHGITSIGKRFPADYYAVSKKSSEWLRHFRINCKGTLYNAINAKEFRSIASVRDYRKELNLPDNTFLVASIGRLVKEKGFLELAKISNKLEKNIVILVAGNGPLYDELKKLESRQFRMLGSLDKNDIAALLLQSSFLALLSRSEGFATVLLEAAACFTPPITTDVGGANEITCNGQYGIIIPHSKSDYLVDTINEACNSRSTISTLGRQIEAYATKRFSWLETAKALLTACAKAQSN